MNALYHALAFLTRFPVPKLSESREDWLRSTAFYPFVGALIGAFLWACASFAAYLFPGAVAAVATLACWVFITGGLHLDGWMDTADGLGSHRPRDEMLAIMKDSRVGAMGAIAAILLLMAKAAALFELLQADALLSLVLPPIAARFCLVAAIRCWPYLSEKGMGQGLGEKLRPWQLAAGLCFGLVISFLVGDLRAIVIFIFACLLGLALGAYLHRRLGGLTGDGYGAIVEWTELSALLLLLILL